MNDKEVSYRFGMKKIEKIIQLLFSIELNNILL